MRLAVLTLALLVLAPGCALLGVREQRQAAQQIGRIRGTVRPGLRPTLVQDEAEPGYDPHLPLRSSARAVGPYQIAQLDREVHIPQQHGRVEIRDRGIEKPAGVLGGCVAAGDQDACRRQRNTESLSQCRSGRKIGIARGPLHAASRAAKHSG